MDSIKVMNLVPLRSFPRWLYVTRLRLGDSGKTIAPLLSCLQLRQLCEMPARIPTNFSEHVLPGFYSTKPSVQPQHRLLAVVVAHRRDPQHRTCVETSSKPVHAQSKNWPPGMPKHPDIPRQSPVCSVAATQPAAFFIHTWSGCINEVLLVSRLSSSRFRANKAGLSCWQLQCWDQQWFFIQRMQEPSLLGSCSSRSQDLPFHAGPPIPPGSRLAAQPIPALNCHPTPTQHKSIQRGSPQQVLGMRSGSSNSLKLHVRSLKYIEALLFGTGFGVLAGPLGRAARAGLHMFLPSRFCPGFQTSCTKPLTFRRTWS